MREGIEAAAVEGEGHGGAGWLVPPPGMNTGAPGFIREKRLITAEDRVADDGVLILLNLT